MNLRNTDQGRKQASVTCGHFFILAPSALLEGDSKFREAGTVGSLCAWTPGVTANSEAGRNVDMDAGAVIGIVIRSAGCIGSAETLGS